MRRRRHHPAALAARLGAAALVATAVAAVGVSLSGTPAASAAPAPRPNVLVIETDDQTLESMKVMANVQAMIGDKGATFPNSFVNFSLCCPSRATFLTGEYAHNHHVLDNRPPLGGFSRFRRLHEHNNLAVWLRKAGYHTALIGKFLNGSQRFAPRFPRGWDHWVGALNAWVYDYKLNEKGTLVHYGKHRSDYKEDVLTRKAARYVRRRAPQRKPFFLWLTYNSPHVEKPDPSPQPPFDCEDAAHPAPRHADAFDSEPLPMPPSFNEDDVSDKPHAIRNRPKLTNQEIEEITRKYRCELESLLAVDEGVKRVLRALRRAGELGRTYVIYTSDNGFMHGEHRIPGGKERLYEESIRVPLLIRGPNIPHGVTARDLAINADLAPTIARIARAKPGLRMDGRSLLPAARHPRLERGRELSIESRSFKAIRTRRYIYATYRDGEKELYDLENDPYELQNLRADPDYDDVQSRLAARLARLRHCAGRTCRTKPHVSLNLHHRNRTRNGRRCALNPIRAVIGGRGKDGAVKAEFYVAGDQVATDEESPFETTLPDLQGRTHVRARVTMLDGRRITLSRKVRACR